MKLYLFIIYCIAFLGSAQAVTTSYEGGRICVNTDNSRLQCWGDKSNDKFKGYEEVAGKKVISFELVKNGGCALLKKENNLKCWGNEESFALKYYDKVKHLKIEDFEMSSYRNELCVTLINNNGELCFKEEPIYYEFNKKKYKQASSSGKYYCGINIKDELECWGDYEKGQNHGEIHTIGKKFKNVNVYSNYNCATLLNDDSKICWGTLFSKNEHLKLQDIMKLSSNYNGLYYLIYKDRSIQFVKEERSKFLTEEISLLEKLKAKYVDSDRGKTCVETLDEKKYCIGQEAKYFKPYNGLKAKFYVVHKDYACIIDLKNKLHCNYDKNTYSLHQSHIGNKIKEIATGLVDSSCFIDEKKLIHCLLKKDSKIEKHYLEKLHLEPVQSQDSFSKNLCFSLKRNNLIDCLTEYDSYTKHHQFIVGKRGIDVSIWSDQSCMVNIHTKNEVCNYFPFSIKNTTEKYRVLKTHLYLSTQGGVNTGCVIFKKKNQLKCWGDLEIGAPSNLIIESFGEPLSLNIENNPYSPIRSLGLQLKKSKEKLNNFHNNFYGDFLYSYINKVIYTNYSSKFKESVLIDYQKLMDSYAENKDITSNLDFYGLTFNGDTIISLPPTYAVKKEIVAIINNILHSSRQIFDDKKLNKVIDPVLQMYPNYKKRPTLITYKGLIAHYANLSPVIQRLMTNHKTMGLGQILSELIAYTHYN